MTNIEAIDIETLMDDVADISSAPVIQFGQNKYAFFWTTHAKERASCQGITGDEATKEILDDLNAISKAKKADLAVNCGYFCIRDLKHGFFAVCHITQDNKRLRVVTYNRKHVLFPREGDLTYQITDKDIIIRIWSHI